MIDLDIEKINTQKRDLEKLLTVAQRRLNKAPEGRIHYKNIRGTTRYYKYQGQGPTPDIGEQYLSADKDGEILALTDKRYCEEMCELLTGEINAMEQFVGSYYPEKKYDALNNLPEKLRSRIAPITITAAQRCRQWQDEPFGASVFPFDEDDDIRTAKGERVRSRAECIIADLLSRKGLAYHYEQRLRLEISCVDSIDATIKTRQCDVFPDFTIMHPKSCELYYLEFFGMMDKPDYIHAALEKIRKYQDAGLNQHLISIFDSADVPVKSSTIETVLKNTFGV